MIGFGLGLAGRAVTAVKEMVGELRMLWDATNKLFDDPHHPCDPDWPAHIDWGDDD